MNRMNRLMVGLAAVLGLGGVMGAGDGQDAGGAGGTGATQQTSAAQGVLDLTMKRIDANEERLDTYRGKVVLIVNVASQCGLTPQYDALQKMYEKYQDRGLVVLGFPSNDFREQEPGTNTQIAEFCTSKFKVTFPMFEKVHVKGTEACDLYKRLAAQPGDLGGEPKWNFTKFLVDRSGKVVARFEPKVKPDAEEVVSAIHKALGTTKP